MNVKLLRKVKRHILAEPKRLYMDDFVRRASDDEGMYEKLPHKFAPCGTAACIAGWAWLLSAPNTSRWEVDINKMLDLDEATDQQCRLVWVEEWPEQFKAKYKEDGTLRSAKVAAARIEHFIKTKGRE